MDFLLENKVSDLGYDLIAFLPRSRRFGSLRSASHLGRRMRLEEESSSDDCLRWWGKSEEDLVEVG